MTMSTHVWRISAMTIAVLGALAAMPAKAQTGKLVLTGGVSTIEGAGGGGLTPWAFIGTQATENEWGVATNLTHIRTDDYSLNAQGVSFGWDDKLELSLGRQSLDTGITGQGLGLPGLKLDQTIVGVKYKLFGDGVLDSDSNLPQVAIGLQHKSLDSTGLDATLNALGAKRTGTDFYVSGTKLFLKQGILVNGTLRATKANQNGLLGFGARLGGDETDYDFVPEVSLAKLLRNNVAVGVEYRVMPNKLENAGRAAGLGNGLAADDWTDLFVAWAPTKNVSLTAAYVDLGRIVPATTGNRDQRGVYVSAQFAF